MTYHRMPCTSYSMFLTPVLASCRLVGVSNVPKTGDAFMDTFLMLPTDALAIMSAEFEFLS